MQISFDPFVDYYYYPPEIRSLDIFSKVYFAIRRLTF